MSFMKQRKSRGLKIDPCKTEILIKKLDKTIPFTITNCK